MALHYRAVWISDTHLGTKGCKADYLRDFLDNVECDYLYLVGDIIDLWKFKSGFYWPALHSDILQRVFNKAKKGTRVIYIAIAATEWKAVRRWLKINRVRWLEEGHQLLDQPVEVASNLAQVA